MKVKLPPGELVKLFKPYWNWQNKKALLVGFLLLCVVISGSAFNAWLTTFTRDIYNAIDKRDFGLFMVFTGQKLVAMGVQAGLFTFDGWLKQWVEFHWRQALTEQIVQRWMSNNNFYRLERQQAIDNPDHRIAEDVKNFADKTVGLGFSFITNLGLLSSMGYLLWTVAGPYTVAGITIPGYMFWVAIVFGIANTLVSHWAGHRISGTLMEQQRVEADFRFAMAQQRDAAEQIAFYKGGDVERGRLRHLFAAIGRNWSVYMRQTVKLSFIHMNFNSLSSLVPIFAIAPKLFSGEVSLGEMMQNQMAYGATVMAVSWFANSYSSLVQWSAVARRVIELNRALDATEPVGIEVKSQATTQLAAEGLELKLPHGEHLAHIGALHFSQGERWLVRGPSGTGKSTLLRSLAGIWPHGKGTVKLPVGRRQMFVPQKSYIPSGTLKEALCYPQPVAQFSDDACRQALIDCRLPHLGEQLHVNDRWAHRLSGGEQQRLAFARVLLGKPDFVFLDEATSALDKATEAALYTALAEQLPGTSVISVAHRETLEKYHHQALELADGNSRVRDLAPPVPAT